MHPVADQDILASWVNIDLDHCFDENSTSTLYSMEFPDILVDTPRPARHDDEIVTSPVTHCSDTIQRPVLLNYQLSIGSLPSSPVYLLNSKLNATILDECLVRIHDTIVTGCASRFIGYECNLYKPGHRYQLEEDGGDSPQDQKPVQLDPLSTENLPKTPSSVSQSDMSLITSGPSSQQPGSMAQDISHRMTILGTIRFLDHFSDLYGNRPTVSARRKSDAVLKAVLRAFSLQWLSSADSPTGVQSTTNYNSPIGRDTPRNSPMDAFYDSWFQARSLIKNALSVQSFRVVYAILMFDGISIPAKASGETLVAHEFLDAGLQKLNCLAGLVEQYCLNLGPHSTYGTIMEASLSVVRWCSHVRDIGAALTADHVCKLSDVSVNDKGQATSSGYEPISPYVFDQGFNRDFDNSVPGICRAAAAEAFRVWKQVVAIKGFLFSSIQNDIELCPNLSADVTSTITAVGRFKEVFGSFLDYCIENLGFLSMRSRLSSVSIAMFWNLGVFVLMETLNPTRTGLNQPCSHSIFSKLQTYNEEAALSVTRTAQCVLSLPFEKVFNLQNGVSAEASILSYHITPTLVAATFQKAIEAILDMQLHPPCGESTPKDRSLSPHADSTWKQHIDTIMKGLVSLAATIGGALASDVRIRSSSVAKPIEYNMSTQLDAASIARVALHDPAHFSIQHSQTSHRLALLQHWNIPTGSNVLELGCGQGDCTTVLANAVGELGRVVAVDPAELDYGAPYTLGQAQDHISQGPLGKRITWVQQSPLDYLSSLSSPSSTSSPPASDPKAFDATVLAHCLWYFGSPSLVLSTFRVLKQHSKRLLLAEWSLVATHPSAQPHVLAALTQAALECRKPKGSISNVRTVLGPKKLTELALAAGWHLESETRVPGSEGLLDGQWEVSACLSPSFGREVEEQVSDERERAVVLALRDACEASLEGIPGGREGVRAMDVWVANFV
ncbi:SAM-dependent methyltransferas-like protein [Aspergillus flavus]|nr:SAM-dependent methyltransferas-like protein [Aspergillus flavus]RAQ81740.1 SAM-dependent methyltransferas-like protein [Aspergillus flavus]